MLPSGGRSLLDEIQELVAGFAVAFEVTQHAARNGAAVLFLHATHHHAEMVGFDYHADAFGLQSSLESISHIRRQPLLHLQPATEDIDHAGNLAQPDDLLVGKVGNMALSVEGQEVMLAETVHLDVFDDDHLVILGIKDGAIDYFFDVQFVSLGEEPQTRLDALWRPFEPIPIDIFA